MSEPNRIYPTPLCTYEIRIRGKLDGSWSDRLGGMVISPQEDESGCTITTLRGSLPDQAALFGVLMALYDLRLPLLFVESLDTH